MLLGIETVFSRSPMAMLNSTFFMSILGLTYLCVDPVVKTLYVLRCFYGESLQSGEDLKAELRQFSVSAPAIAASIVLLLSSSSSFSFSTPPVTEPVPAEPATSVSSEAYPLSRSGTIAPPILDQEIQRVIEQRKYSWRGPREQILEPASDKPGIISRFIDSVWSTLRKWVRNFFEWLGEFLRKLFARPWKSNFSGFGSGGVVLQILLYLLIVLVACAIGYFIYLALTRSGRLAEAIIAESVQPLPDVADENISAEQLPEDGWTRLANELLQRGEFRLAGRNLVSLAKFKSNHDYERELQRRGHSFPELLKIFGDNVSVFERIWYGLHEINAELVRQFAANVQKIKADGMVS
jgi:hypothetical protein